MSKYNTPYGQVVEREEGEYLVNGKLTDELTMFRPIDDVLEAERDNVQLMLEEHRAEKRKEE